jgi:nucleoside-diphosphate-sugar epimerase
MQGFALVDYDEEPDFVMVGGLGDWYINEYLLRNVPVLLLSSDCVYSDRDFNFDIRDKKPMREDDPIFIPSPLEPTVEQILSYLSAEHEFLKDKKTMVLRIFNVYGPDISHGLIHTFLQKVNAGEPLPVYSPGYHTRTYLSQSDFLGVFGKIVHTFLRGTTGIYNLGSEEETSIKRLADSIWQLKHGPQSEVQIETDYYAPRSYRWWVLPDLTRTKAVTKWKPRVTLRTGLWEMLKNG